MVVFCVEQTKGFTVMSKHHLRNTELSLKAKGLLFIMLSLPEGDDAAGYVFPHTSMAVKGPACDHGLSLRILFWSLGNSGEPGPLAALGNDKAKRRPLIRQALLVSLILV